MIRRGVPVLLCALLVAVAARGGEPAATPAEAVRAAEQAFADAFAARDLTRFAAFIHEDAVFTGRDGPLEGREGVLAVWRRYLEPAEAPFSWAPERVLVSPDGSMGTTTGPVRDARGCWIGAFSSTWMKQPDGTWQVVFDISPSCPPPRTCDEGVPTEP